MPNDPTTPPVPSRDSHGLYYLAAESEDRRLAGLLTALRAREDSGELTTRQAADQRVALLEHHLDAIRQLRVQYLGGES